MRKILHQLILRLRQKFRGTPKHDLHKLAFNRDYKKLEEVLTKCSIEQINEPEKGMKWTPIFIPVSDGLVESVKLLIKYGANVNALDVYGRPPLYYIGDPGIVPSATAENRLQIAKLLLDNGADINITDTYGNQPLGSVVHNAGIKGKEKDELLIVKLFMEHGADPNHKNNYGRSPLDIATKPMIEILESHKK
ncbi:ankyrin repeat domain-containing protein [Snodgrassella sp. B3882]|uniref:ankyrin repeat domain-containing protein n=1 Tax=Snodgrassella sp. B3882 TaxID=2818037 RepID=UPI00226AC202|nr:ankyrin repeat domain-containing protein [Snodgrassella sp. B3882]MCX8744760.1 ankyrin repeat domain-containing protein [Snodgrassella sp. B3882]